MMKKGYILTALMLSAAICAQAQNVNRRIKTKEVKRIIATLSADDMEGRATFSPGIDRAATFIEKEFKKAGLKPLAGNTGFRQNIPDMTRSVPVKIEVTINGTAVPAENIIGAGGASFSWKNDADVQVLKETADKNFRTDYRGFVNSGKKTLVLVDPAFAEMFKQMRGRTLSGTVAAKPNTTQQVIFVLGKFDDASKFEAHYEIKNEQVHLFNVAGMIPGKSKADEYVVFSGHYDHLGIGKGMSPDSIYNGADDDASGTTAVITLAKYFKRLHNNQRTLIFVAFTAEEIGGFGARHFTTTVNPDKVAAMFNIEMIGKASKFGQNSAFITGYERSDFGKILQKNLEGTAFKFYPDPYPAQNLFYRSDNATLARAGVPAHSISTDQIDTDPYYHKVGDELKTLDVENIATTIRAIALSARSIVNGTDTPTRVSKLER